MGVVYEAEHLGSGKRVALKTLRRELLAQPEIARRFVREGRAAASVEHPNVVDVTDFGVSDGRPFLAMELLRGEDLASRLERLGRFRPGEAVEILLPVIDAVRAIHHQGIIHRDLKPANIFLAQRGGRLHPVVLDFGVAKLFDSGVWSEGSVTQPSTFLGTLCYAPPEQLRSSKRVGVAADQYALGAVAYEMLAGRRAFEAASPLAVVTAIAEGDVTSLRRYAPDVPRALEGAVHRALSLEPAHRFADLREFGRELRPFAPRRRRSRPAESVSRRAVPGRPTRACPSTMWEWVVGTLLPNRELSTQS